MMTNPSFLLNIAYLLQQEMLQQAEAERLYRQLKGNRVGLLKQISYHLLGATRQFKAYAKPGTETNWASIN